MYEWKYKGQWNKLGATVSNTFVPIEAGSAEEFIFEHYWGYNTINSTTTLEYAVEHIAWNVAPVSNPIFEAEVGELYGKEFIPFLKQPFSAFFAKGSDVAVRVAQKIRKGAEQDLLA
jgi:hypothetical protein